MDLLIPHYDSDTFKSFPHDVRVKDACDENGQVVVLETVDKNHLLKHYVNNCVYKPYLSITLKYKNDICETKVLSEDQIKSKYIEFVDSVEPDDEKVRHCVNNVYSLVCIDNVYFLSVQNVSVNGEYTDTFKVINQNKSMMKAITRSRVPAMYSKYKYMYNGKQLINDDDFIFPHDVDIEITTILRTDVIKINISRYISMYGEKNQFVPKNVDNLIKHDMNITFEDAENINMRQYAYWEFFVTTLTCKTIVIYMFKTDTIQLLYDKVKERIKREPRLVCGGDQLEKHYTIDHYFNGVGTPTIHCALNLRGGGGSFANVQKMTNGEWSLYAPHWRSCVNGLNLEGKCTNEMCKAYDQYVIDMKGYTSVDMPFTMRCPVCKASIVAQSFVTTLCNLTIVGKEVNGNDFTIRKTISNTPYYPESFDDQVTYEYLSIKCSELDFEVTTCGICCDIIKNKNKLMCGHTYCNDCISEWFKIKRKCPICQTSC